MKSQNVRFEGSIPPDGEFEHPPGASLARALAIELKNTGWQTSEFDNWRDSGWIIRCSQGEARMDVVFSPWDQSWLLQVAAADSPGLLGGMVGRKPSATESDITKLAKDVHAILTTQTQLSVKGWRADGPPDEKNSAPVPTET